MFIEKKSHIELFRNVSVHEFYRLKALITLEQMITSVVEKKKNSLSRFTGLLEDLERGSRIEDRELGIENRGSV